jgi:CBS domain-containing protein
MLDNVTVSEWMSSPAHILTPKMSITEAHNLMKRHNIRRMPVVEREKLVGMVTIGDIREASPSDATTLSIWEVNYLWAQLTVERVMSRQVVTVTADMSILDAAEMMLERKISGLPVVDARGQVVGILTESDIFKMLVANRVQTVDSAP